MAGRARPAAVGAAGHRDRPGADLARAPRHSRPRGPRHPAIARRQVAGGSGRAHAGQRRDHGPLRRGRVQRHAHARRRALALRGGGVLLEQFPHPWTARRSRDPSLAVPRHGRSGVGAAIGDRVGGDRVFGWPGGMGAGGGGDRPRQRRPGGAGAGVAAVGRGRRLDRARDCAPARGFVRCAGPSRANAGTGAARLVRLAGGDGGLRRLSSRRRRSDGSAAHRARLLRRPGDRAGQLDSRRVRQQRRLLDRPAARRPQRDRRRAGGLPLRLLHRSVVDRLAGAVVVGDAPVDAPHRGGAACRGRARRRRRGADRRQQRLTGAARAADPAGALRAAAARRGGAGGVGARRPAAADAGARPRARVPRGVPARWRCCCSPDSRPC